MFLIIHEVMKPGELRSFKAHPKTYREWADADKAASETARRENARSWVVEIPDPPMVEDADIVKLADVRNDGGK